MAGHPTDSTLEATFPALPQDEAAAPSPAISNEPEVPLDVGHRAGEFVIEGVIGRGSFGTVYRAAHAVIGRRAAVKVLRDHAAAESAIAKFVDEARLVARLRHPNIVDVLTFGQLEDGRHYQVMDLIEGPTLGDFLRDHGAVPLNAALPILRGIASALDVVHRAGVAHSDLKPANVVLERREGEHVPKLIDFGVAQLIAPDVEHAPAARTALTGTPRYMSPEQCRGRSADARADAYAFGLVAYEMLTGRPPFSGDDALELMLKHTSETPVAPSQLASLPSAVDAIILALLEKRPERRPVELVVIVHELEAIASGQSRRTAQGRKAHISWRVLGIAAGVVATVVALVVRGQRGDVAAEAARVTANAVSRPPTSRPPDTAATPPERRVGPEASLHTAVTVDGRTLRVEGVGKSALSQRSLSPERRRRVAYAVSVTDELSAQSPATPGLEDPENPFDKH